MFGCFVRFFVVMSYDFFSNHFKRVEEREKTNSVGDSISTEIVTAAQCNTMSASSLHAETPLLKKSNWDLF